MTGIKQYSLLGLLLFALFLTSNNALAAEKKAGKTLLTRGDVITHRAGSNVTLKRRSAIFESDEIRVGKSGRAQFRMIDQAIISLQENSVLQIKKYQYAKGSEDNSALLELLSGGLRTITGAIGKGNKKAYELRTPLATIGIRGTDYEVEVVSNGMYVAVWDGVIHLRSRARNGCNILLGDSQPFMFIFIDQLGKCNGLDRVPNVFKKGHSSNIAPPKVKGFEIDKFVAGAALATRASPIDPLEQLIQDGTSPPAIPVVPPVIPPPVIPPPVTPPPVVTFDHNALTIDQSQPTTELDANASELSVQTPTFKVGSNLFDNIAGGVVENFQQSVGGFAVSWGYWGEFTSSQASRNIDNNTDSGLIWATYEATDPAIVAAKTGSFSRYETLVDSLISASAGPATNLQVQMDMNFETGDVTHGALSVNTPNETWVAVFDGKIVSGDLDLQMNGASVINSDPSTLSPDRDASGFISGDFIGGNAEAVLGAFGLSEDANPSNHVEGVFIVE